jgi:3-phosphoshikimate 1-carboxyvinyltransferase
VTDSLALPPVRAVRGTVAAPPSKSATNRALLLAALSPEPVQLVRPLDSDDTRALVRCLRAMGAGVDESPSGLVVRGPLGRPSEDDVVLDAGGSGTAARFLAAVAAAVPGRYLLTGSAQLVRRPMGELVAALRSAGASVESAGPEGYLPLAIRGGSLRSGDVVVDASRSGQFLSSLLLAGVAVEGGLTVYSKGTVASAPYVDTTLEALREFGHSVARGASGEIAVRRGAGKTSVYEVPGDWSSALPFFAAAGIAGGEVSVTGLRWPSPDADAGALEVVASMGVAVERDAGEIRARGSPGALVPVSVEARDFPDAVPALAALAVFAAGESRFRGIAHLRLKESDRIAGVEALATAAGARCVPGEDELSITGPPRRRGLAVTRLRTFDDHRLAMAAALLSLALPSLLIETPDCVAKSYPTFFRDLETILVRD